MAANVAGYRAIGYRKFQLKVGGNPDEDIERIHAVALALASDEVLIADANTGWNQHEAVRVVNAVRGLNVYIEQPCRTYNECMAVRERTSLPMILDEVVTDVHAALRVIDDRSADVVNLKISRFGGITRMRQVRDLFAAAGIAMTIEDAWGGDVVRRPSLTWRRALPRDCILHRRISTRT